MRKEETDKRVVDNGQTCLKCINCSPDPLNPFTVMYCKEFDKIFHSTAYICKHFKEAKEI